MRNIRVDCSNGEIPIGNNSQGRMSQCSRPNLMWLFAFMIIIAFSNSQILTQNLSIEADGRVTQQHITLGDSFAINGEIIKDHLYTISVVASAEGVDHPQVKILDSRDGIVHTTIEAIKINPIDLKSKDVGIDYSKTAYFFKITPDNVVGDNFQWGIFYQNKEVTPRYGFPSRARLEDKVTRLFVIADMDLSAVSQNTAKALRNIDPNKYDIVMHVGDFAYEIEDENGNVGDLYFEEISSSAHKVPYIISPGNHENFANLALFNYRFRMPNSGDYEDKKNNLFDFVYKNIYFMSINLDYIEENLSKENDVFEWAKQRLEKLELSEQSRENKADGIKWRVFFSHRPFYCNDPTFTDEGKYNFYFFKKFEDLLVKHNFHLIINGHLHYYSRSKPITNFELCDEKDIGKGGYIQFINGHSGTRKFFPGEEFLKYYTSPAYEKIDVSGETYLDIKFTAEGINGELRRSDGSPSTDFFSYFVEKDKQILPVVLRTVLLITVLILSVLMFFCILNRLYPIDSKDINEMDGNASIAEAQTIGYQKSNPSHYEVVGKSDKEDKLEYYTKDDLEIII